MQLFIFVNAVIYICLRNLCHLNEYETENKKKVNLCHSDIYELDNTNKNSTLYVIQMSMNKKKRKKYSICILQMSMN